MFPLLLLFCCLKRKDSEGFRKLKLKGMKKTFNFLLIITSLFGYTEWGENNHAFIFEMEYEILEHFTSKMGAFSHPLILIPLIGQLLLIVTLFQKEPNKKLTFIGLGCLSLIILMFLLVGILSINFKIIGSTIPFILVAILTIRGYLQSKLIK